MVHVGRLTRPGGIIMEGKSFHDSQLYGDVPTAVEQAWFESCGDVRLGGGTGATQCFSWGGFPRSAARRMTVSFWLEIEQYLIVP
jgi:hypothetical protein